MSSPGTSPLNGSFVRLVENKYNCCNKPRRLRDERQNKLEVGEWLQHLQ